MPVSAHKYKVSDHRFRSESFFAEGDLIVGLSRESFYKQSVTAPLPGKDGRLLRIYSVVRAMHFLAQGRRNVVLAYVSLIKFC